MTSFQPNDFNEELQQFGLPKEHANKFTSVYVANSKDLKKALRERFPKLPALSVVRSARLSNDTLQLSVMQGSSLRTLSVNDSALISIIDVLERAEKEVAKYE